jgi:hypothetical protein
MRSRYYSLVVGFTNSSPHPGVAPELAQALPPLLVQALQFPLHLFHLRFSPGIVQDEHSYGGDHHQDQEDNYYPGHCPLVSPLPPRQPHQ